MKNFLPNQSTARVVVPALSGDNIFQKRKKNNKKLAKQFFIIIFAL